MDSEKLPVECHCPESLKTVARAQGITCDKLFRFAYEFSGDKAEFGEAVFMRFATRAEGSPDYLVPLVVKDFCRRVGVTPRGIKPKEDICRGCMLSQAGRENMLKLCSLNFPDMEQGILFTESTERRTELKRINPEHPFSQADRLFLALLETGAQDADDVSWEELIQTQEE